jgi:hypothetical protein
MSWSQATIKIDKTGVDDAIGANLVSIGTIKDKSTSLNPTDGDSLTMKASGGVLIAKETFEGEMTLTTRLIEPDFKTISRLVGTEVQAHAAALANATSINIEKGSKAFDNMYLSDGTHFAQVTDIVTTDPDFDVLTITLGAAVAENAYLYECNASGDFLHKSQLVPDFWSVEVSPKNVGGTGIRARKTRVSYRTGYTEEEGQFADVAFTFLPCPDDELYTKFVKS